MDRSRDLLAWALLARTERCGTLSAAAGLLGISLSKASRMISELEAELGTPLLDRRRKPAVLSEAARAAMPAVERLLDAKNDLDLAFRTAGAAAKAKDEAVPVQTLRVSLPVNMGRGVFLAAFRQFEAENRHVKIEILGDALPQDVVKGNLDIAWFGYRPAPDPGIYCEDGGVNVSILMASRRYVERCGAPKTIEELKDRPLFMRDTLNGSFSGRLECGGRSVDVSDWPNLIHADALSCREQLLAGSGIAGDLTMTLVADELLRGEVVAVLPGWHREPWHITLACPFVKRTCPVTRSLMRLIRRTYEQHALHSWTVWYKLLGIDPTTVRL
ncbi:MAG: hypothetical protein ACFWTZ_01085 [Burkholderia sp.]|jgi:DNA-binding transcriptional LysR family regulator